MTGPVLGLCSFTHDSAAALVVDGELVGLVEEERLSGIKHDKAYPAKGIAWLLNNAGLHPLDVETVALHFRHDLYRRAAPASLAHLFRPGTAARAIPRARSFLTVARNERSRTRRLRDHFPDARITQVLHHRAHGLTAFAASGFDEAAVLVVDSLGETQTTTIAFGHLEGGVPRWDLRHALSDPASLGYAYGAVTQHLGWRKADEEGTVMALAALGDPGRFRGLFQQAVRITSDGFTLDPRLFPLRVISSRWPRVSPEFVARTCPPRGPAEEITQVHRDLAAALQERTEQIMLHLARLAADRTGSRRLCVGGGVAMNCVSIGKILASGIFEEIFVPPAPGDSGTALGAALAVLADHREPVPGGVREGCFLGPSPLGHASGASQPSGLTWESEQQPARRIAEALAEGAIVGVCVGRAEAGPRALGHRSILASPLLPDVIDRLNSKIKFREPFRPFAPIVLAEQATAYFDLGAQQSPFMSIAVPGTAQAHRLIPSVFHANGLARVQTVDEARNPRFYRLLAAFRRRTGCPVLVNTSFNVRGEPIVATPGDALRCFLATDMDALVMEDVVVTKGDAGIARDEGRRREHLAQFRPD